MKKIIFPGILLCLLFVSCKKETITTNSASSASTSFVSSVTYTYTSNGNTESQSTNYYRDANGRVTKIVYSDSNKYLIQYVSSSLITTKHYKKDSLVGSSKITLNDKGYFLYSEEVNGQETYLDTAYYDPNGFRLDFNNQKIVVENGNVTKRISKSNDTTFYEFDLTKSNSIGEFNIVGSYLEGKDNKNLIISEKRGVNSKATTKYTYEFDSRNRVTKKMTTFFDVNGQKLTYYESTTYTYTN